MMRKQFPILMLLAITACAGGSDVVPTLDSVANDLRCETTAATVNGLAQLRLHHGSAIQGDLGCLALNEQAPLYMRELATVLGATGDEALKIQRSWSDIVGSTHVKMDQQIHGLPVVGAQVIVHARESSGHVYAVTGHFASAHGLIKEPNLDAASALSNALVNARIENFEPVDAPELVYVLDKKGLPVLAWSQHVAYESLQGPELDRVFADAVTGRLVTRHPKYHRARFRQVFDAGSMFVLPGSLAVQEGGSSGDADVQDAYDHSGTSYDYFFNVHGLDSYDDNGSNVRTTVHYGNAYNNAFWTGSQMAYGDGDGANFGPFAKALDVVGHEFAHGVTQFSAGLIYQNESGAMSEAMSDIFGAAVERFDVGAINANTWLVGEDCYTPGTANDALRYMDNPTGDGISYDFYPERYTGSGDNGGVHINSGIANLSFYLMSQGGSHPRAKTEISVTGIGFDKAELIFYRALTTYMTSSSGFFSALDATVLAATDLYGAGSQEVETVETAWAAVGVANAIAGFTADPTSGYAPLGVQFTDESTYASLWNWTFGDGGTSALPSPYYTYEKPGTFTAGLQVNGGDNQQAQITVYEKPHVDFFSSRRTGQAPVEVVFENLSNGEISGYSWDFGDGNTSTEANPTHTYTEAGEYTVSLTAIGVAGGVVESKEAWMTVTPGAEKEGSGDGFFGFNCSVSPTGKAPAAPLASLGLLALAGALVTFRRRRR